MKHVTFDKTIPDGIVHVTQTFFFRFIHKLKGKENPGNEIILQRIQ